MSRAALRFAVSIALGALVATDAPAQRPTPADRTTTFIERLPMPTNLAVRQTAEGYVALTWNPVPGAKQYILGRSLGTNGYQRVYEPLAEPTRFVDRGVPVGTRVSYTVTAVDSSDIAGMRAISADFTPTAVTTPTATTPTAPQPTVVASRGGDGLVVRWEATTLTDHYDVQYMLNGRIMSQVNVGLQHEYTRPGAAGQNQFVVISRPTILGQTKTRYSNVVVIEAPTPAATDSTPSTSPTPTASSGPSASATAATTLLAGTSSEVSLTVASPAAVGVGATTQLSAPTGSQWLSLDPAIADVSAAGLVTARGAGTARIVALTPQAAGAMRVTVVHVTVSP